MVEYGHVWPKDHPLFRIHSAQFGSTAFNDSGEGNARFSPLISPDKGVIPTMYGATTFVCASMETVFHDLPGIIGEYIFDFNNLEGAAVSIVAPMRDLKLLALTSIGLRSMNLKKTDVIETSVDKYPDTRKLALQWHEDHPDIDGLYWTSRQDDQAQACMLFGDRVDPSELKIIVDSMSVQETPYIEPLVQLAKRLGIMKMISFPSSVLNF